MIALLRYQTANLFRSHRWILPLIAYALLISVGGTGSNPAARSAAELARLEGQALASGLDWSAAILVPVVALLTRSMLTAEPGPARACVAAARGPGRAQLTTLLVALASGLVLGLAGACYELATNGHQTALLLPFLAGLGQGADLRADWLRGGGALQPAAHQAPGGRPAVHHGCRRAGLGVQHLSG